MQLLIISWPCSLSGSKHFVILSMSLFVNPKVESELGASRSHSSFLKNNGCEITDTCHIVHKFSIFFTTIGSKLTKTISKTLKSYKECILLVMSNLRWWACVSSIADASRNLNEELSQWNKFSHGHWYLDKWDKRSLFQLIFPWSGISGSPGSS